MSEINFEKLIDDKQRAVVKKAGIIDRVSKDEFEQRVKCIVKSKQDIAWWANHFFRIVTLDRGLQIIKCYEKQEEFLRFLANEKRIITMSARQTGKCVFIDSIIKIKNKKTGKIEDITIGQFFEMIRNKYVAS